MIDDVMDQVSVDQIGRHVRALQGVRHPVVAPEALERAAAISSAPSSRGGTKWGRTRSRTAAQSQDANPVWSAG